LTVRVQGLELPVKAGHCLGVLNPSLCIDHPRAGLGLPVKTGHCLSILNPSLCIDRPRAGTWTPRQNGTLPGRSEPITLH